MPKQKPKRQISITQNLFFIFPSQNKNKKKKRKRERRWEEEQEGSPQREFPFKHLQSMKPTMEKSTSTKGEEPIGLFSCWGRLRLRLLSWKNRDGQGSDCCKLPSMMRTRHPKPCGFRYDPLSYAQNFDEGGWDEDSENSSRGFSSRFAIPLSKPVQDRWWAVLVLWWVGETSWRW